MSIHISLTPHSLFNIDIVYSFLEGANEGQSFERESDVIKMGFNTSVHTGKIRIIADILSLPMLFFKLFGCQVSVQELEMLQ